MNSRVHRILTGLLQVASLSFGTFAAVSCEMLEKRGEGAIRLSCDELTKALYSSGLELPDTSDFILTVSNSDGKPVYDGRFGDAPEQMAVPAGSYTIKIVSSLAELPGFDCPVFGDEQCIQVKASEVVDVKLVCTQLCSGVKLKIGPEFLTEYPDGVLFLKSKDGKLMYGYSEKRIAYFNPGPVSLVLNASNKDKTLMTRTLEPCEVITIGVRVASSSSNSGRITVSVDTSRTWTEAICTIGGDGGTQTETSEVLTVYQARNEIGAQNVWVSGYIVGGDLTSSSASFDAPFSARTNILLGSRSSSDDKQTCLSVQLPSGSIRDALNLVDNPALLGKKVQIRGDIVESYYGIPGLKNLTGYEVGK